MDNNATITTKSGAKKIGKPTSGVMKEAKDATVNDRDRLNGILMHEKQIALGYSIGLNEAIDSRLYEQIQKNRSRIEDLRGQVADALFEGGEYTADIAPMEQVLDAYDIFSGYRSQLPY